MQKKLYVGGIAAIGVLVSLLTALSSTRVAVFVAMGFLALTAILAFVMKAGNNTESADDIAEAVVEKINLRFESLTEAEVERIMSTLPVRPTAADFETALKRNLQTRRITL